MDIDRQETIVTLANPRWKTQMCLDLMKAQADSQHRLTLHNQAIGTLNDLVRQARFEGREDLETLYCGCLEKLRTGYDL